MNTCELCGGPAKVKRCKACCAYLGALGHWARLYETTNPGRTRMYRRLMEMARRHDTRSAAVGLRILRHFDFPP